jgi:diguanylate cyclase (GGDEF)-like protein
VPDADAVSQRILTLRAGRPRAKPTAFGTGAALWQYLAFQWAAGALLLTLILQATPAQQADHLALYAICAVAYVFVAVMLAGSSRLPVVLLEPTLVLGHVLISLVVYFSGEPATFLAIYYVWLNVYAFHFLGRRSGWLHTALALAFYAVTLSAMTSAPPLTPWLMTAGTMIVIGSMVASLRGRVDRLVAQLAAAATRDPLTGLLNRRGFADVIAAELERARRAERPFSLLVADIDRFKLVNDRVGHSGGDVVLRRIAELLRSGKRQVDSAARLGGEEFVLLVPDTDGDGALVLAERLRERVRATFADDAQPITLSVGIATFPDDAVDAGALLRAADDALYAAKRAGRDRSVVHRRLVAPQPVPLEADGGVMLRDPRLPVP